MKCMLLLKAIIWPFVCHVVHKPDYLYTTSTCVPITRYLLSIHYSTNALEDNNELLIQKTIVILAKKVKKKTSRGQRDKQTEKIRINVIEADSE